MGAIKLNVYNTTKETMLYKLLKLDGIEDVEKKKEAAAVISVCCYCIFLAVHTATKAAEEMVKELKEDKSLYTYKGYGNQLKAVEKELLQLRFKTIYAKDEANERMDFIESATDKTMAQTLLQIRMSVWNWGNKNGGHNPKLLSAVSTAQAVTFWAATSVKDRLEEINNYKKYGANFGKLRAIKLDTLNSLLVKLLDRCGTIAGDDQEADVDINNCAELITGLRILDKITTDVDLLSINTSAALELEKGTEVFKREHLDLYYKLHPDEDPEVIAARKAREEEEERKAAEMVAAFEAKEAEERAAKEREAAGAEEWAEELEAARGWKVRKKHRGNR